MSPRNEATRRRCGRIFVKSHATSQPVIPFAHEKSGSPRRTDSCRITWTHGIARQDVRLDITDLYVFRGQVGTVFVINVCHSIAGAVPSPGFHPEGMYEFKVDLNGDFVEEITYRVNSKRATRRADSG